jgi:hypothetical protein
MRCQICLAGDDTNLIMCDGCDRGFHLGCIVPKITEEPKDSFFCSDCVQCVSCQDTSPGPGKSDQWHSGYSVCSPCWKLYRKKQYCPVCQKVWTNDTTDAMIGCDKCGMWVHAKCDGVDDESHALLSVDGAKYFCGGCRASFKSKEILEFKKRMRWFSKKAQKRFKKEQMVLAAVAGAAVNGAGGEAAVRPDVDKLRKRPGPKARGPGAAMAESWGGGPTVVDTATTEQSSIWYECPPVAFGTVDVLSATEGQLPPFHGMKLPSERELRGWDAPSQKAFWVQRRAFWVGQGQTRCEAACRELKLPGGEDGASHTHFVTLLTLWDFHRDSLHPPRPLPPIMTPMQADPIPEEYAVKPEPVSIVVDTNAAPAYEVRAAGHADILAAAAVARQVSKPVPKPAAKQARLRAAAWSAAQPEAAQDEVLAMLQLLLELPTQSITDTTYDVRSLGLGGPGGDGAWLHATPPRKVLTTQMMSADERKAAALQRELAALRHSLSDAEGKQAKRSAALLQLTVVQKGEKAPLVVSILSSRKVKRMKDALQEASSMPSDRQRLTFGGTELESSKSFASYKIASGSMLVLDGESSDEEDESSAEEAETDEEPAEVGSAGLDTRVCALCHVRGDKTDQGRLLPTAPDTWVHTNCALWSAETYEDESGKLHEVHRAMSRCRSIQCNRCALPGASVGCCTGKCTTSFHFMCAVRSRCLMTADKQVYCVKHKQLAARKVTAPIMPTKKSERKFAVLRKVYIPTKLDASFGDFVARKDAGLRLGSLTLISPGRIVYDCPAFHTSRSRPPL